MLCDALAQLTAASLDLDTPAYAHRVGDEMALQDGGEGVQCGT